jgi:hypothetical protein
MGRRRGPEGDAVTAGRFAVCALAGAAVALGLAITLTLCGCSSPTCRWERATVAVAVAATDEIERIAPEGEGRDRALAVTREALDLGDAAVQSCEDASARPGLATWVSGALRGLAGLLDVLKAAGVPVPGWISLAVAAVASLAGGGT